MQNLNDWGTRYRIPPEALQELLDFLTPPAPLTSSTTSSEARVQRQVRLATNATSGLLLRNNSGTLTDSRGVPVRFGLGNDSAKLNKEFKSSDLVGLTPILIEPRHVGFYWGVFTSIEVKKGDWRYRGNETERGQLAFINAIKARGGIAGFATSENDYFNYIKEYKK